MNQAINFQEFNYELFRYNVGVLSEYADKAKRRNIKPATRKQIGLIARYLTSSDIKQGGKESILNLNFNQLSNKTAKSLLNYLDKRGGF